jgi:hypothetical protein
MSLEDIAKAFFPGGKTPPSVQPHENNGIASTEQNGRNPQFGSAPYSMAKSFGSLAKAISNKRKPKSAGEADSDATRIGGAPDEADA